MSRVHYYAAFIVPVAFGILAIAAIIGFLRNKPPGQWFWTLLAVAQVTLGVQVLVGAILFLSGLAPPGGGGPIWLHYAYGGLFPAALLVGGHRLGARHKDVAWVIFGGVAILNCGLTVRALLTGLG